MKSEFRKRPGGTALALFGDGLEDSRDYRIENLKNNRIEGMLPLTTGSEDGVYKLFYDITGRQALSTVFAKKKLERKHVRALIKGIASVMESAGEYLLEPGGLIFEPEHIYMSGEGEAGFLYFPDRTETVECALHSLGEYLIGRVDHGDPEAVKLSYGFFEATGKDNLVIEDLKKLCALEPVAEIRRESVPLYPKVEKTEPAKSYADEPSEGIKGKRGTDNKVKEESSSENGPHEKRKKTRQVKQTKPARSGGKTLADYIIWAVAAGVIIWLIYDNFLRRLGSPKGPVAAVLLVLLAIDIIVTCIVKSRRKAKETSVVREKAAKAPAKDKRDAGPARASEKEKRDVCPTPVRPGSEEVKREYYGTGLLREETEKTGLLREDCEKTGLLSESTCRMPGLVPGAGSSGKPLLIPSFPFVVGKSLSYADGAIDDTYISRVHCRFEKQGGEFFCVDLNSRNGTSINGTSLEPGREYAIHEGDELKLGRSRYTFSMVES